MRKTNALDWLHGLTLLGREEGDDPYERDDKGEILVEDEEQVLKEGWELDDDGKPVKSDPEGNGGDDDNDDDTEAKIAALEKSLSDERKLRRKIERDAKRNSRKKQTDEKKQTDDELQKQLTESAAKTERLAAGLLKKEIESAVKAEARKQGFIDETDALTADVLREIDADQDEDDPTEIDIDTDSVRDAVKELARKKKHLVGRGTPGEKSGGKFRKKGGESNEESMQQTLEHNYPSLR